MRVSLRPEAEATGQEVGLQDRLKDDLEGSLDHPVANSSDPERTELRLARLWYPDPPHRLRTVGPVSQAGLDGVEETLDAGGLDVGDGDPVDTRGTLVVTYLQPR